MTKMRPIMLIIVTAVVLIAVFVVTSLPYGKFSAVNGVWALQYGAPPTGELIPGDAGLSPNEAGTGGVIGHLVFSMDQAWTFNPFRIPLSHLVVYRLTANGDLQLVPRGSTPGPGGYWTANSDGTITVYGTGGSYQGVFYFFNFANPASAPKTILK